MDFLDIIEDIDTGTGIIIYLNETIVYKNKYIKNEFGDDNYINILNEEDQQSEIERLKQFMEKNIESVNTMYIKAFLYNIKFTIYKKNGMLYHIICFIKLNENNFKEIFLANVSHEYRTPISGILGMITLLEDTNLTAEQLDYIDMIKECSFNLMTVVNDILDYSKLESNKMNLEIKCINLRKCIESTSDIILGKILSQKNDNIEYSYFIDKNISENIMIDENRLKQILLNLLSNSIKFTNKGLISLEIILENDLLRINITDTGIGIKKSDFPLLFKSFSQLEQSSTKVNQGTGLGLAICKYIIKLMNGKIWIENSKESVGTTFSLTIPYNKCECNDNKLNKINDSELIGKNVLILDDNFHNRLGISSIINKFGMNPTVFSTTQEALYFLKIQPEKFQVGLIDICMPKSDGYDFATKLNEQNKILGISLPLIALSSINKPINTSKNDKLFKHFITKPIKETKLKN